MPKVSPSSKKILSYQDVVEGTKKLPGKKKVLVGGCFDILHFGHLTFLQKAKEVGDTLVVALESDKFVIKNKKKQPIHNQNERAIVLAALSVVDYIITLPLMNKNADYQKLVEIVSPQFIAITKGDPNKKVKEQHAKSAGAKVIEVTPHLSAFSSSRLRSQ